MNIQEHQGKALPKSFGASVFEGQPAPAVAWLTRLGKTLIDALKG